VVIKEVPLCCETRMFITAFRRQLHSVQYRIRYFFKTHFNITLQSKTRSRKLSLLFLFSNQHFECISHLIHARHTLFDLIIQTIWSQVYKFKASYNVVFFILQLLPPRLILIFPQHPILKPANVFSSRRMRDQIYTYTTNR
jgi:hypothetical protein